MVSRVLAAAAVVAAAAVCTSCGARTAIGAARRDDAGVHAVTRDVAIASDSVADRAVPDSTVDAARFDAGCAVTLTVGAVTPTPSSCWIDQKVAGRSAPLEWSCADGPAEAAFAVPFVGEVKDGVIALTATTTFAWSDGCTWQSRQSIDGVLSSRTLIYRYAEHPIAGSGCAPAYCTATATVVVR